MGAAAIFHFWHVPLMRRLRPPLSVPRPQPPVRWPAMPEGYGGTERTPERRPDPRDEAAGGR